MPSGTLRPSSSTDSVLIRHRRPSTSRTRSTNASGIRKGKNAFADERQRPDDVAGHVHHGARRVRGPLERSVSVRPVHEVERVAHDHGIGSDPEQADEDRRHEQQQPQPFDRAGAPLRRPRHAPRSSRGRRRRALRTPRRHTARPGTRKRRRGPAPHLPRRPIGAHRSARTGSGSTRLRSGTELRPPPASRCSRRGTASGAALRGARRSSRAGSAARAVSPSEAESPPSRPRTRPWSAWPRRRWRRCPARSDRTAPRARRTAWAAAAKRIRCWRASDRRCAGRTARWPTETSRRSSGSLGRPSTRRTRARPRRRARR